MISASGSPGSGVEKSGAFAQALQSPVNVPAYSSAGRPEPKPWSWREQLRQGCGGRNPCWSMLGEMKKAGPRAAEVTREAGGEERSLYEDHIP